MILTRESLLEASWSCYGDQRGCYRRVCPVCRGAFYAGRPQARYCRAACRQRAYRRRRRTAMAIRPGGVENAELRNIGFGAATAEK
jgi:hypothetical protein